MTSAPALAGVSLSLETYGEEHLADVARLDRVRGGMAVMGGMSKRPAYLHPLDVTLVARSRNGDVVGVVDARALPGYDRVVNVTMFFDPQRARRGVAMEAYTIAGPFLFGRGVRVIHHEVLDCNTTMRRILERARIPVRATMREHAYVAGRFWDVHVYSLDEEAWHGLERLVGSNIPSLGGRFASLGG